MTRSQAREQAFILVFEKEFNSEYSLDEIISSAKESELFDADDFAKALSSKALENVELLDAKISEKLKGGWRLNRISKVALAVLRLAICEILFFDDIPVSVSVNEAVELSKKYAAEEDASFVNGLLSSVIKSSASNE